MSDEYKDVTRTGLLLGGAGLGAAAALAPTIMRNRAANKAAMKSAEKIVKHLKHQGIKKDAVIAITGVGGSGKSSISRALKNHGYKHIPLDGVGDAGSAAMSAKGFSPGTVVDQAFVLKKTGGGHYDAVIKADNPGQKEIRRRLVKRQQGAKTLYNHIDYGKFDDEISADFDRLAGARSKAGGASIVITKNHKAENAVNVPISSSQATWKKIYGSSKVTDPITNWDLFKNSQITHGAGGAIGGGGLAAGAGMLVDKNRRDKEHAMNRLDRLIELNAKTSGLLEFRYDDEESHLIRNTAIGGGALAAGGVASKLIYDRGQDVLEKHGKAMKLAGKKEGKLAPGVEGPAIPTEKQALKSQSRMSAGLGDVGSRAKTYASNIGSAVEKGAARAEKEGAGWLGKAWRGVKYGAKAAIHRKFSSREERLIELNSKLNDVIYG